MADGWNAWRELRARPEVTFARAPLPAAFGGAVCARWNDGAAVIVVDPSLGRRERHEAVAHELTHLDLGGACEGETPALEVRIEEKVRRTVADRCVPPVALSEYVRRRVADDEQVSVVDVAEHFDVTDELARLALHLLVIRPRP